MSHEGYSVMKYASITLAEFIARQNRFAATVRLDNREVVVHVKNTGRLGELLVPGARVALTPSENPSRKTHWDLVSVYRHGLGWVNVDSQLCNQVVSEWLAGAPAPFSDVRLIKTEYTYGESRFDFYMERADRRILMEVKGCTLERGGVGWFPDAPTKRGVKHLRALEAAIGERGYECFLAYVIAMPGVHRVLPNSETHPEFAEALAKAQCAGLRVLYLSCRVSPEELTVIDCTEAETVDL